MVWEEFMELCEVFKVVRGGVLNLASGDCRSSSVADGRLFFLEAETGVLVVKSSEFKLLPPKLSNS